MKQEYAYLEIRHARIMNGIKLFNRQIKPFAMKSVYPIVSQRKK
jgi:hypothetical protein